MNNPRLRKFLHGIILKDFCTAQGIEYSQKNVQAVKQMFKDLFGITVSSESLSEDEYRALIQQIIEVSAVEFGTHLPLSEDEKSMSDLLKEENQKYKDQNNG
jgi:hypothetical protein